MFIIAIVSIFLGEFIALLSTTFTLWPEMVLYPWLHNNSFLLYKDIINPYFPGLTWVLSVWTAIFGYNPSVFIFFTWIVIFLSQLFLVFLVRKLFNDKKVTILSLLICAFLSVIFETNGLWFDLAVALPLLLGFYSLLKKKYLLAGIFLAIGILIKQTVIWSLIGSALYIIVMTKETPPKKIKYLFYLLLPTSMLLFLLIVFFYLQGIIYDFLFWAVQLPFGSMQKTPGFVEFPTKRNTGRY